MEIAHQFNPLWQRQYARCQLFIAHKTSRWFLMPLGIHTPSILPDSRGLIGFWSTHFISLHHIASWIILWTASVFIEMDWSVGQVSVCHRITFWIDEVIIFSILFRPSLYPSQRAKQANGVKWTRAKDSLFFFHSRSHPYLTRNVVHLFWL